MKYIRRIDLRLRSWHRIYLSTKGFVNRSHYLERPIMVLVLGTEWEQAFYHLKEISGACSCSLCKEEKYKRKRSYHKRDVIKELEYESCCDWIPRIH